MLGQKIEISLLNRLKLTGLGGVRVFLCLTLVTGVSADFGLSKLDELVYSFPIKVSSPAQG